MPMGNGTVLAAITTVLCVSAVATEPDDEPSSSLLANAVSEMQITASTPGPARDAEAALLVNEVSLFFVPRPEDREFALHDLVTIIVHESSTAKSTHELETEKEFQVTGDVNAFPDFRVEDLLNFFIRAGRTEELPSLDLQVGKEFSGDGEYERKDDLSARLTAEVVEVLPNGNLILEARTSISTDEETSEMTLTGICRPDDVTPANTVLSNQIHDLNIRKEHSGELKKANQKGLVTKFFDFFFAW